MGKLIIVAMSNLIYSIIAYEWQNAAYRIDLIPFHINYKQNQSKPYQE